VPDLARGARIGVDVGKARIGLAGSDPDGLVATPVETVPRVLDVPRGADGAPSVTADVARIAAEVTDRFAAAVYVGLPRHLSGSEGAATADAREFAGRLARVVAPVPVHLVDDDRVGPREPSRRRKADIPAQVCHRPGRSRYHSATRTRRGAGLGPPGRRARRDALTRPTTDDPKDTQA
jgi:putative transcription antitermination factor YqgF